MKKENKMQDFCNRFMNLSRRAAIVNLGNKNKDKNRDRYSDMGESIIKKQKEVYTLVNTGAISEKVRKAQEELDSLVLYRNRGQAAAAAAAAEGKSIPSLRDLVLYTGKFKEIT